MLEGISDQNLRLISFKAKSFEYICPIIEKKDYLNKNRNAKQGTN